jgi:hypothetical protein
MVRRAGTGHLAGIAKMGSATRISPRNGRGRSPSRQPGSPTKALQLHASAVPIPLAATACRSASVILSGETRRRAAGSGGPRGGSGRHEQRCGTCAAENADREDDHGDGGSRRAAESSRDSGHGVLTPDHLGAPPQTVTFLALQGSPICDAHHIEAKKMRTEPRERLRSRERKLVPPARASSWSRPLGHYARGLERVARGRAGEVGEEGPRRLGGSTR